MLLATAIKNIKELEGPFSIDPNPTNWGIEQDEYDKYRKLKGLPIKDIRDILDHEITDIYVRNYWLPLHANEMPDKFDFVLFQAGVNIGNGTAAKILQGVVGVPQDGRIGIQTIAAVKKMDTQQLIDKFLAGQKARYQEIGNQTYLQGWFNRISKTREMIRTDEAGVSILYLVLVIGIIGVFVMVKK